MTRNDYLAPGLALALALAVVALTVVERRGAEDRRHHGGRVAAASSAVTGSLRVELRGATYERGIPRATGGRSTLRWPRESATRVELWLRNDGAVAIAALPATPSGDTLGACHALVDDAGRRYPALAATWTPRPGEPARDVGLVLPGWGAGVTLEFTGIPIEVGALALELGCLAADGAPLGPLRLAVPLP